MNVDLFNAVLCVLGTVLTQTGGSRYADQLYEDLLYDYNKNVRPNKNATDVQVVLFGSSLIRIIDVDEKKQQLKTNLWLDMQWYDNKFKWNPSDYDGLYKLHVPSDSIWTPDIVLYNTADGDYEITSNAAAIVYYDGTVVWKPPQIYTSFCKIDISYFPYDVQSCPLKFGGWTYTGFYMDMRQIPIDETDVIGNYIDQAGTDVMISYKGMDLGYYYRSIEWDLVNLTSERRSVIYPGCCGPVAYIDITFFMTLRRKTLFFTCNLIIPSMLVAVLTTFVFYIPSADHKITFAISILLQQMVFYNIMMDLIPPSSDALPLFGQYLLFTIILVSSSIFISVATINLHRRKGSTHRMPEWMRVIFIDVLPVLLFLKRYEPTEIGVDDTASHSISASSDTSPSSESRLSIGLSPTSSSAPPLMKRLSLSAQQLFTRKNSPYLASMREHFSSQTRLSVLVQRRGMSQDVIQRMLNNLYFITDHFKGLEDDGQMAEEWAYVAMVVDRCFFIIFTIVNAIGTVLIINQAPPDPRDELPAVPPVKPLGGETPSGSLFFNHSK